MQHISFYIAEPVYGGYEGIYTFGGEPMGISEVDYLDVWRFFVNGLHI